MQEGRISDKLDSEVKLQEHASKCLQPCSLTLFEPPLTYSAGLRDLYSEIVNFKSYYSILI